MPCLVGMFLGLSVAAAFAADKGVKTEEHVLRATVVDVVPMTEFSGVATQVDVDPRFVVTLRVESVKPEIAGVAAESLLNFAIHSPAMMFGREDSKKSTHEFSLWRESSGGKTRFSRLKVRR